MIRYRPFKDYTDYTQAQGWKSFHRKESILQSSMKRRGTFKNLFSEVKDLLNPGKILCLGARTGCEVIGAREAGFTDSLGIDLYPMGEDVVQGDWHNLSFIKESFENIFTNSIDHCYDLNKFVDEVFRVLKPKGRFFVASLLKQSGIKDVLDEKYEALFWDTEQDYLFPFLRRGFIKVKEWKDAEWFYAILEKDIGKEWRAQRGIDMIKRGAQGVTWIKR